MGDIDLPLGGFIALDWSLLLFSLCFVGLRLYVRFMQQRRGRPPPSTAQNISSLRVWVKRSKRNGVDEKGPVGGRYVFQQRPKRGSKESGDARLWEVDTQMSSGSGSNVASSAGTGDRGSVEEV